MLVFTCECGKNQNICSGMMPSPCDVCNECGTTTLKRADGTRVPPIPHEYATMYNQTTGKPYERCTMCYRTREEIEMEG